ncbi:hypothetical protein D3C72_1484780 [compost metagenome]
MCDFNAPGPADQHWRLIPALLEQSTLAAIVHPGAWGARGEQRGEQADSRRILAGVQAGIAVRHLDVWQRRRRIQRLFFDALGQAFQDALQDLLGFIFRDVANLEADFAFAGHDVQGTAAVDDAGVDRAVGHAVALLARAALRQFTLHVSQGCDEVAGHVDGVEEPGRQA